MKTYQEFSKSQAVAPITEASVMSEVIALNKGREGKPVIGLNGEELKGTVYLGDGYHAKKDGGSIVISPAQESSVMKTVYIATKHFDILKKAL
ncbi:internal head protein [Escherichia phage Bp7]|uniref:Internal head protein n=1 Tax=Escherichia phage Bp7 TaxID=1052121 RepID=G3MV64_9CAUD|nr:internal virion protein [Escherichia phage Bp7]AEN93980.1 internal head protein [Escherichia phage Bp7]